MTPAEETKIKKSFSPKDLLCKNPDRVHKPQNKCSKHSISTLTSLSLLALIVGLFLIYNTMTFSVVQRKVLIGTLRSIGVTSNEISRIILREALIIGIIGTIFGFTLAYFISKFLIVFISQTINDLYYVVSVREIYISPMIIIKGASLGIIATILSAIKPAKEASRFILAPQ